MLQALWEVHVLAHVHAARAVLPSMIARGRGYLLNTASAAGLLTQVGSLGYTVTKHAAVALAEWLAITHHHQGIRVSVLCPQAVRTNITANSPDARVADAATADGPLGVSSADAVVEADEVARQCIEAIADERFWVLPHPEVARYVAQKADDIDRWLAGMRRFQARLYGDRPLPGRLAGGRDLSELETTWTSADWATCDSRPPTSTRGSASCATGSTWRCAARGDGALRARIDERPARLVVTASDADRLAAVGWEASGLRALDAARRRPRGRGMRRSAARLRRS